MLLKNESQILRVLKADEPSSLVIDCRKRTMPYWVDSGTLKGFAPCDEAELYRLTEFPYHRNMSEEEQRIAHERYTLIAGVLPFVADEKKRSQMIAFLAEHQSKQTIRKYLCLYLVYQDISALAPGPRKEKELSADEKNMRWALNKFFYTKNKNSLMTAYTLMLREKYCRENGQLAEAHPSFYQFRYFYRRTKKLRQFYIARNGIKDYQRNERPLLGDGIRQFAPAVGVAMLDSTVCDIYLVNDGGQVVGRPVLTACVDAYSGLCCGYSLGWEGGTYSLRSLMRNVVADKPEWCRKHGVFIDDHQWSSRQLPGVLVTDMGSEYKGDTFSQITELGVKIINLPPYRPELKGMVEKFFDVIQSTYKKHLKGQGVIEPDYRERGARDYRKDACLTLVEFEQIILHCIVYYNSRRVVDFPFTEEMLRQKVPPYANSIFNWGRNQVGSNLISVPPRKLMLVMLPRTKGVFTRKGLRVHGLRYKHEGYTEAFLQGGEGTVAYNPEDVTEVWLIDKGAYIPFTLIETRFSGKDLNAVRQMQEAGKQTRKAAAAENLQAQIDLAEHIQVIASRRKHGDVVLKHIRSTRRRETSGTHMDFMKEGISHE